MSYKKKTLNIRKLVSYIWHLSIIQFFIPARFYSSWEYRRNTGKKLNLNNPKTFNEKLQWLKLFDNNPFYTKLVDKYEVRKYVAEKIGKEYLVPLVGVYESPQDIPFSELPEQYVLKCTHDSGTVIIKNSTSILTEREIKQELRNAMKRNYYYEHRERPYKNITPRIICEKYMVDETGSELKDYKVFCFNGKPKLIQVDYGRFTKHHRNLYDIEWNYLPFSIQYPTDSSIHINKPNKLPDMLRLATVLAKDFPHVRVDFYSIYDRLYFGEMTFYHGAGLEKITPDEYNLYLGEFISLPYEDNNRSKVKK
ncbi:glycosyl transferase [Peribacillus simplex]|uniref:Glycosyl transferase n=1 Tax=Peribacillus simplex TaxID=1478 RepID=A0A8B5XW98_9BACI|nr:ATP-grasp fold amidoligase family protein [Peribacillus simplex]TVX79109.1 glycosyl transferase [Peribacillus simplex]